MSGRDWDDDSDYHRAVGCTWIMVVVALVCSAGVIALWVAGTLGASFLTRLFEGVR
ncbi:hypothetical protein ACFYPK_25230 [Streptomyces halstedii]|uniref:hypothetical protein n=1 Tax=Streptomyces TaxID=1883 RepID=UPI000AB4D420|nr:hypothetical protein [Streptomyces sp. NTK 937]WSX36402.1 hypothetical protein OG291_12345 [Streptomyces halstedii]